MIGGVHLSGLEESAPLVGDDVVRPILSEHDYSVVLEKLFVDGDSFLTAFLLLLDYVGVHQVGFPRVALASAVLDCHQRGSTGISTELYEAVDLAVSKVFAPVESLLFGGFGFNSEAFRQYSLVCL